MDEMGRARPDGESHRGGDGRGLVPDERTPTRKWRCRYEAMPLRGDAATRRCRYEAMPLRGDAATRRCRYGPRFSIRKFRSPVVPSAGPIRMPSAAGGALRPMSPLRESAPFTSLPKRLPTKPREKSATAEARGIRCLLDHTGVLRYDPRDVPAHDAVLLQEEQEIRDAIDPVKVGVDRPPRRGLPGSGADIDAEIVGRRAAWIRADDVVLHEIEVAGHVDRAIPG